MADKPHPKNLQELLSKRDAVVGVIGLGYVGLPFCIAAVFKGLTTIGFDVDPDKPSALEEGRSYLKHIENSSVEDMKNSSRFSATTNFDRLAEPDVLVICVPTPLTRHKEPDLTYLIDTTEKIAERLRPGQLVILESTTYPGTTEEVMLPILEAKGLKSGEDFFLAFSPEREDPGNAIYSTSTIPKVVGADTESARTAAEDFYSIFIDTVVMVSDTRTAEMVKLTENIFRSVNIALVNEMKVISEAMDVDIWEVIDAAKTKPFGFMPFYPGPGLGGHCIPIDPFYLTWKAKEYDIATRFIELAGEINTSMPYRVVERLVQELDARVGKGLNGSRILIGGIAYKKNVDDMRESPALKIMEILERRGAQVSFYDPFVPKIPKTREHPEMTGRESETWRFDLTADHDAVLIVTDHDTVDYENLVKHALLIVDTRNACRKAGVWSNNIALA
ncbi:nucleotide sugar dehydrogenase [Roseovarius sp. TE539]|uniref:nucleotide sugar dehydrogenase n=1 Tax=Roseovarius sp. TE539 TaxID=2249812 RepID=UPI000DE1307D|nr:nucleotide sugar dehydrogenase [Roseovarius sp. TE539]RBI69010.1 nucleotide sugar dehydrogenase [Roseovarius sp. TE539]